MANPLICNPINIVAIRKRHKEISLFIYQKRPILKEKDNRTIQSHVSFLTLQLSDIHLLVRSDLYKCS